MWCFACFAARPLRISLASSVCRSTSSSAGVQKAEAALDGALKERETDAVSDELATALQRVGELSMEVELLRSRIERPGPCMGSVMSSRFHWRPSVFCIQNRSSEVELSRTSRRVNLTRPYNLVFGGPMARTMMLHSHRERGSEGWDQPLVRFDAQEPGTVTTASDEERRRQLQ